jgi:hypothetical protein
VSTAEKQRIATLDAAARAAASKLRSPDSFALVPAGGGLVIVGGARSGVLYGAYRLLEELGVRWYAPGALGEVVRPSRSLRLPDHEILEAPQYVTRGFFAWENRGHKDFSLDSPPSPNL